MFTKVSVAGVDHLIWLQLEEMRKMMMMLQAQLQQAQHSDTV